LNTARQFATDNNLNVRQIIAEIAALRQQLAAISSTSLQSRAAIGQLVEGSTTVDKLTRELDLAQSLYDNYKRFLQGTSVEDLTPPATVRFLEPAYIDSERQYNIVPMTVGLLLLLLALTIEFYRLRPPLGDEATA